MKNPSDEAERLLRDVGIARDLLERHQADVAKEINRVKQQHAGKNAALAKTVSSCEKRLEKLVRTHKDQVLSGADRADFSSGSVMLKLEGRVKRIKGMLERLKAEQLDQAVKVAREVVDWDAVDKFDDDTLVRLGTARVKKEWFSYELKKGAENG